VDLLLAGLADRGWSPDEAEVELPPAPAIGGGTVPGPAPRLAVRIQGPSPERAAELRRRWPAREPAREPAGATHTPLLPAPVRSSSPGHLSYSALADYAGCGYRFYVERVLGLASPLLSGADATHAAAEADEGAGGDELIDPELGSRERSLAIGTCVHAALERSALSSWATPTDDELEALLAREGIAGDAEARARVRELVENWLGSTLRADVEAGGPGRPEVPFVVELGGAIVRGKIDLLCETADGPLVVDYKTDALRGADAGELAQRYATQRDLYAVAAGAASDAPVRAAYCFLEAPELTVVEPYDRAGLEAARGRLERLIGRIGAGEFARTEQPHRSLCFGCPAAARLCGKPAWRPGWASSAP
jgi:hypothetical protein